jgi:hypothetical protein
MIAYTVIAHFTDSTVAEEWISWLQEEHLAEVLAGGALDAEVTLEDQKVAGEMRCEVRYHFASAESFAAYERDSAPALRAKGLARFPLERGIRYQRHLARVRFRLPK